MAALRLDYTKWLKCVKLSCSCIQVKQPRYV